MRTWIAAMLCLSWNFVHAQPTGEHDLFSFRTEQGTEALLSLDSSSHTLCFKLMDEGKELLVVKDDLRDSVPVFTFAYYLRGGGADNEGLDLNYLRFRTDTLQYELYQEYSSVDDSNSVGLRIRNTTTGEEEDLPGLIATWTGSLSEFRFSGMIPVLDE